MSETLTLSAELRRIVEARMDQVLRGVDEVFNEIIKSQKVTPSELKKEIDSLQERFNLLFQKWSLEILYTLLLKNAIGFGELKRTLSVNSRTLSDKLKMLQKNGYITRDVSSGPPLRVEYSLTRKGKDTALLGLPLLYYSSKSETKA